MTDTPPSRTAQRGKARSYNRGGRVEPSLERDRERLMRFQYPAQHQVAWAEIKDEVWLYAAQRVLPAMIRDGRVWRQYRELRGVAASRFGRTTRPGAAEARDLAIEVTTRCIPILYKQLKASRWDPTRETTIATWFVNLCVLCFPRVWNRAVGERLAANLVDEVDVDAAVAPDRPEAVIYDIEFERELELLDPSSRVLVRLDDAGFSDDEIAELVNDAALFDRPLTRKAVERRLARTHRAARDRWARGVAEEVRRLEPFSGGSLAAPA